MTLEIRSWKRVFPFCHLHLANVSSIETNLNSLQKRSVWNCYGCNDNAGRMKCKLYWYASNKCPTTMLFHARVVRENRRVQKVSKTLTVEYLQDGNQIGIETTKTTTKTIPENSHSARRSSFIHKAHSMSTDSIRTVPVFFIFYLFITFKTCSFARKHIERWIYIVTIWKKVCI